MVSALDQVVSGLTNSVFALLVARSLTLHQFGTYASALVVYSFALLLVHSLITEPANRLINGNDDSYSLDGSYAASTVIGLSLLPLAGALFFFRSPVLTSVAVVICGLTGLMSHETIRQTSVAAGKPLDALIADAVWLTTSSLLLLLLEWRVGVQTPELALFLWMAGAWAGVITMWLLRQLPLLHLASGAAWLRTHWRLGAAFSIEGAIMSVSAQIGIVILGSGIGLEAVGIVRSVELGFGLVGLAVATTRLVGQPWTIRLAAAGRPMLPPLFAGMSIITGFVGVSTLVWLVVPQQLGEAIAGPRYNEIRAVAVIGGVFMLSKALAAPSLFALRALGKVREVLWLRVATSAVQLSGISLVVALGLREPFRLLGSLALSQGLVSLAWITTAVRAIGGSPTPGSIE